MVNSIFENRRAVRKYSNEAISDEKIQEMIAAFQTAPCGMHQANVMNLVVVKDEGLRNKIEEVTNNSCYNAPVLFLINTKKIVNLVNGMHQLLQRILCLKQLIWI